MESDPSRRRTLIVSGAVVVWVAVLVFGWAIQPIDDAVPVEIDPTSQLAAEAAENPAVVPTDAPRAQTVSCNSLLDSTSRDRSAELPSLPDDFAFAREPCDSPWREARWTAVVNVVALIALVIGWQMIERRLRDDDPNEPSGPVADSDLARTT